MSDPRTPRSFVERHRFGRVGRIPTPTPFPVGDINSYLVFPPAGSESLTLVDTGVRSPESFEALRRGLKEFGFRLEQIERILVTHAHPDHFGQARRLREISGATVYASAIESERMKTHWLPSADRSPGALAWFRRWGVPEEHLRPDPGRVRFEMPDVNTAPGGGRCKDCYNDHGIVIALESEWRKYTILFEWLEQRPGWGDPAPELDKSEVYAMEWEFGGMGRDFDISLDDIAFVCDPEDK